MLSKYANDMWFARSTAKEHNLNLPACVYLNEAWYIEFLRQNNYHAAFTFPKFGLQPSEHHQLIPMVGILILFLVAIVNYFVENLLNSGMLKKYMCFLISKLKYFTKRLLFVKYLNSNFTSFSFRKLSEVCHPF